MKTRKLRDLEVSAVGMGCMGFSHGYGPLPDKAEAIRLIRQAHELGCTFYDTAQSYGIGANEELVGEALQPIRSEIILATKFRASREKGELMQQTRNLVEISLKRLSTDHIDLFYQHRVNPEIPVEEFAACIGRLILKKGKSLHGDCHNLM
ncbi:hypothetical protein FACS1894167_04850 [Synergistales bacterium]|nr:hypothetical protein FACS1894167_04850 [Synergistales bacterium]